MTVAPDDETLADLVWSAARHLRHGTSEVLAPYEIAPGHFRALGTLLRHGDMRLGELSDRLHIAPRSATEVVDALELRGLVRRRPDPQDRRATVVEVTAEGQRINESIRAVRVERQATLFSRLGERERADLARILRKLSD